MIPGITAQRRRELTAWWLSELERALRRYVSQPDCPTNTRGALDSLLDQYREAVRIGHVDPPVIPVQPNLPSW
jgi:hypothetical protein